MTVSEESKQLEPITTMVDGTVALPCPDCGTATSSFHGRHAGTPFGRVIQPHGEVIFDGSHYYVAHYILLRCAGCGRGGLAAMHAGNDKTQNWTGPVTWFAPAGVERFPCPSKTPAGIVSEFREAEDCAAVGALRGAAALLRSTMEKVLEEHKYDEGRLTDKIDAAANDGLLTEQMRRRAHQSVKVLGNDVLHGQWRKVTQLEYTEAHLYAQRLLEAFYDDPAATKAVLAKKVQSGPPSLVPKIKVDE